MERLSSLVLVASAGATVLVSLSASATAATPAAAPEAPVAPVAQYQQVASGEVTAVAGTQTGGTVACPAGTRVTGGGALVDSMSRDLTLNGSLPDRTGRNWRVYVNNASNAESSFQVYAVCARRVAGYAVVTGAAAANPAFQQSRATVQCPTGTVPLGGGGYGSSTSPLVGLNATSMSGTGWYADINNDSPDADTARAVVVCGTQPTGYRVIAGRYSRVGPESQSLVTDVVCPAGLVVIGGGAETDAERTSVDVAGTLALDISRWGSYYNNSSSQQFKIRSVAVCAKRIA